MIDTALHSPGPLMLLQLSSETPPLMAGRAGMFSFSPIPYETRGRRSGLPTFSTLGRTVFHDVPQIAVIPRV
ncbi:hypothetical protein AS029_05985 [Microbacterium enclense]|nr:hypothetical protein AS029_05985 [Microbacterium enclense]